jgi:ABC-type antimicrobial peptide transport system permease subunit
VRIAVGGSWQRVVAAILRSAVVQVGAGVAIGLPAAFIAGRFLQARLFGVAPYDPLVIAAGLALLACSAAVAALLPAARAARMDPVRALRID